MPPLISYAQNLEDVMLWRALGHVRDGRYIDIGAHDPVVDSVSLLFYERGWRGIDVEPTPAYATRLREARAGDLVVQAALGTRAGTIRMFEFPGTGLSTLDPVVAAGHVAAGREMREIVVAGLTLDDVLANAPQGPEIHWMKIDVEGGEAGVLQGWSVAAPRPWIVVVESTQPLSQESSHAAWEPLLLDRGYEFAYFDGLNRFYIACEHAHLSEAFAVAPNVFDGFRLSGTATSPLCAGLNERLSAQQEQHSQEHAEAAARISRAEGEAAQLRERLREREREALEARALLAQASAERERERRELLQSTRLEASQMQRAALAREKEMLDLLRAHQEQAGRLAGELSAAQKQARDARYESEDLSRKLEEGRAEVLALRGKASELQRAEQRLAQQAAELEERLQAAGQDTREARRELVERETELGSELTELRTTLEASERKAGQLERAHEQRQKELATENRRLRNRLAYMEQTRADIDWRLAGVVREEEEAVRRMHEGFGAVRQSLLAIRQGTLRGEAPTFAFPEAPGEELGGVAAAPDLATLLQHQDRRFVECAYLTVLKRKADVVGFKYYLGRLRSGVPKIRILAEIASSREARKASPDLAGLPEALRQHRLAHLPVVGRMLRQSMATEIVSGEHNRLRALEQQMFALGLEVDGRLARFKRRVATVGQVEAYREPPRVETTVGVVEGGSSELPERALALLARFRRSAGDARIR